MNKTHYLKKYRFKSFYAKMLIAFSIIFIVSVFIIGIVFYTTSSSFIEKKVEEVNTQMLKHLQLNIDSKLSEINLLSTAMATNNMLKKDFEEHELTDKVALLNSFFKQFKIEDYIESVYIYYHASKKIMTSRMAITDFENFNDKGWYQAYKSASPLGYRILTISERDVTDNLSAVHLLTIIRDFPGTTQKVGSIVININKEKFFQELLNSKDSESQLIIIDKNKELIFGGEAVYSSIKNKIGNQNGENQRIIDKGRLVIRSMSSQNKWEYIALTQVSALKKDARRMGIIIVATIAFIMILGTTLWLRLSWHFYNPIVYLMDKISEKGGGEEKSTNELESLNSMIDTIIVSQKNLAEIYEKSQDDIAKGLMVSLCNGDFVDEVYIKDQMEKLHFSVKNRKFAILIIVFDKTASSPIKVMADIGEQMKLVSNEFSADNVGLITALFEKGRIVTLMSISSDSGDAAVIENAFYIQEIIKNQLGIAVTIGIGSSGASFSDISISYSEALDALSFVVFTGQGSIIHINDYNIDKTTEKYFFPASKQDDFIEAVKIGNLKSATEIVDFVRAGISQSRSTVNYVSEILWQLENSIFMALNSYGIKYEDVFNCTFFDDQIEYSKQKSVDDMTAYIKSRVFIVTEYLNGRRNNKNKSIIEAMIVYIDNNYDKELSLNDFSTMFYMSPSYISTVFKEVIGDGFTEYLRKTRMEKSKELLLSTNLSIDKITKKVGYDSLRSFVRVFKSYEGVTPSEYRKNNAINSIVGDKKQ